MTDSRTPRRRLLVLLVATLVWTALIVARLFDVQVYRAAELEKRAQRQQLSVVDIAPVRGAIRDRHGTALALSKEVRSAYAVPTLIEDPAAVASALAPVLGKSRRSLERRLARADRDFVWLARKLTDPQADAVAALDLPGIGFRLEPKRFYPRGTLAAHVLGFVGLDNAGLAGIELLYDGRISGVPGYEYTLRDARGVRFLPEPGGDPAEPGHDLVLTLDATLQYIVERELAQAVATYRALKGVAIVMDPWTGDILAMAGAPTFDPNAYGLSRPEVRRNPAVQEAYEPGSTFKMMTFAAALEAGRLRLDEGIDCGHGSIRIGRSTIRDHHSYGTLTPLEIIQHSSNVGAIVVGSRVPQDEFHAKILAFGFGRTSGVELPGESPGLLQSPAQWSNLSRPSISMGQEIGVTPLQLTAAFAAIANGGTLVKPRIVLRTNDAADVAVEEPAVVARRRVITPQTAATLTRMMEAVVTEDGTASKATIPGVRMAGKTGTAEKIKNGTYAAGAYVASFVAFAPADAPRLVVMVAIDEPRGGVYYGGLVAAPVVRKILEGALPRFGITVADNTYDIARPVLETSAIDSAAAAVLARQLDGRP